jgi:hypothetical protein
MTAMPAVTYVAIRAYHAGWRHPGPPSLGLGHEADNLIHLKNINCLEALADSLSNRIGTWNVLTL